MNTLSKRILLSALIIFSLLLFPLWITALLVIAGILAFNWFVEAVIAGFLMDSLYGVPISFFHGYIFIATLVAAVILAIAQYVKPKLR
jgi:hypothetical protein